MQRLKAIFEILFLTGLAYAGLSAILAIYVQQNILAIALLVPGYLSSHAYPMLLWIAFVGFFYKRFGWKTAFVFFLANSLNGLAYELSYYGIYPAIFGKLPLNARFSNTHFEQIALELVELGVALYILKPWRTLKVNQLGYVCLFAWLATYPIAMLQSYPITIYEEFRYAIIPNLLDIVGLIALPYFVFSSVQVRDKSYLKANLTTFLAVMSFAGLMAIGLLFLTH